MTPKKRSRLPFKRLLLFTLFCGFLPSAHYIGPDYFPSINARDEPQTTSGIPAYVDGTGIVDICNNALRPNRRRLYIVHGKKPYTITYTGHCGQSRFY